MTTTIALTSQDFIAFINAQPESLEIDHKFWHTCATGEYIASVGGISTTEVCHPHKSTMIPENYEAIEGASKALTKNIQLVGEAWISLYWVLDSRPRAAITAPTYGALQKLIIDCTIKYEDKVVAIYNPRQVN